MDIGQRVKELRDEKNMSQKDLGKLVGLNQGKISDVEHGRKVVFTTELLIKLAAALHTTTEYLVEGTGVRKIADKEKIDAMAKGRIDLLKDMSKEELAHHYRKLEQKQEDLVQRIKEWQEQYGE